MNLEGLKAGPRNGSDGKGMTEIQARASALCEAIERHSGNLDGTEPRRMARLAELGGKGIHPNDCMLFSRRQYENRAATNARQSAFNNVPEPFDADNMSVEWSPVWSLTAETCKFLPTRFLYYIAAGRDGKTPRYFHACSNGAASGNTLEEAVLQGFFELVERDAVALWWYPMVRRPAVDLESFRESQDR